MQALILAGGKGTRLRPYTTVLPKPLMPVGDLPILEIIIRQLRHYGVDEIVLAVGYMKHLFQAFFQDGQHHGVRIRYSFEEEPLGTAGPIAMALDDLDDDFIVMNGDLLTSLNYERIFAFHREKGAAATIGLFPRQVLVDFGVIESGDDGRLTSYTEKPSFDFSVSMGVNVFRKSAVLDFLTPGTPVDIPDLMLSLKSAGHPVYCYREACEWLDIGRLDDYEQASDVFESRRARFLPDETS